MPTFGPATATRAPRETFTLNVRRDDDLEPHQFQARVISDIGSLAYTLTNAEKHPERAIDGMLRMIAKMLDDKDGVPAKWQATPLPARPDLFTAPRDDDHDGQELLKFRAPDGRIMELTPENTAPFADPAAGSSRRRWNQLMFEDEEASVPADDLVEVFRWLVGLAGKDRTRQSG